MAAAVPALPGQSVLELGTGVGTALLCLSARVPGLDLAGVEIDPGLADLARENAARNGIALETFTADVRSLPSELRDRSFDHVISNPPFFRGGTVSVLPSRGGGRHESIGLDLWIDLGLRRVAPGGRLTLLMPAGRLDATLASLAGRAGSTVVRPLVPRAGRDASLVIVTSRKGASGPLRLTSPFVLHEGDSHLRDGDSYTPAAQAVLRQGEAFPDAG